MKWYNKKHHQIFSKQLGMALKKVKGNKRDVLRFTPLVLKFTRRVGLEESKVGVLSLPDIQQAAFAGLVEGWNNINWDTINESQDPDKTLVNYLSSYIDGRLKRSTLKDATGIGGLNQRLITKTKQELMADSLFGNWLYSFKLDDYSPGTMIRYIDVIDFDISRSSSHENDLLNDKITTMMFKYLNDKERDIIRWSYGIDSDKLTSYEIGDRLGMNANAVRKAQSRAIKKLNNDECYDLLKQFL